jgi:hypothetical protein
MIRQALAETPSHRWPSNENQSPGTAGALNCEPLKAAIEGRQRDPTTTRHRRGGPSPPHAELVQTRVFLFLLLDAAVAHHTACDAGISE